MHSPDTTGTIRHEKMLVSQLQFPLFGFKFQPFARMIAMLIDIVIYRRIVVPIIPNNNYILPVIAGYHNTACLS